MVKHSVALLSQDLMFGSQISGVVCRYGVELTRVEEISEVHEAIRGTTTSLVLIDLNRGLPNIVELLRELPERKNCYVVAFGPHVQVELLEQALAAGCDEVLPNSQLIGRLSQLLQERTVV